MTDLSNRESTLFDLAKQYRASQVRSANENTIRADLRETVDKLGLDPKSFQDSIRMELELTEGDRMDYVNGLNEMSGILKGRTVDLLGEDEARRKEERIKRREEKAAKAAAAANPPPPDNPRGDPAKGGAGGVDGKKKAKDAKPKPVEPAVTKRKPRRPKKGVFGAVSTEEPATDVQAQEQATGGALLDGALDRIKDAGGDLVEGEIVTPGDEPEEDGDALIQRVSAQRNAELAAREAGGMAPIDASGDGEPAEKSGDDGKPLSQSAQSRRILEENGLNKPL